MQDNSTLEKWYKILNDKQRKQLEKWYKILNDKKHTQYKEALAIVDDYIIKHIKNSPLNQYCRKIALQSATKKDRKRLSKEFKKDLSDCSFERFGYINQLGNAIMRGGDPEKIFDTTTTCNMFIEHFELLNKNQSRFSSNYQHNTTNNNNDIYTLTNIRDIASNGVKEYNDRQRQIEKLQRAQNTGIKRNIDMIKRI